MSAESSPAAPSTDPPEAAESSPEILLWTILGGVILGLVGFGVWLHGSSGEGDLRDSASAPALPIIASVPDFTFTDRDGSAFHRDQLLGQPWVADFIFTRCVVVCPRMTEQMSRVVESLGASSSVRFVSFSVDPEHDTPQRLDAYARKYGAPDRWHFLTGDRQQLHTLSKEGFLLAIADVPQNEQTADSDEPIIHSNRFVLVDAEGQIRSFYDAFDDAELERLLDDLDDLTG